MPEPALPPVGVRPMRADELTFAVRQHLLHFPDGFFAQLGESFLLEYYRTFLSSPHACLLLAEDTDGAMGYLAGILHPTAHRAHVLQAHRRRLAVRAAAALMRHPVLMLGFLHKRSVRYARKVLLRGRPSSGPNGSATPAVLSHIVVDPARRGQGVGWLLILALADAARTAGCGQIVLVTETGGTGDTYYRHHGWLPTGQHQTPDGKCLTTFKQSVSALVDQDGSMKGSASDS